MAKYDALAALPGGEPGPWGEPVTINYDQRDVLLYSVGIGIRDLRYVYEGNPEFAVFLLSHSLGRSWSTYRYVLGTLISWSVEY